MAPLSVFFRKVDLATFERVLRTSPLMPPDWVFGVVWPVLKVCCIAADVRIGQKADSWADPLIWLRAADWLAFLAFPAIAFRSRRAAVVTLATLCQLVPTLEVVRRSVGGDTVVAGLLAPQLVWLAAASALPLILAPQMARH